MINLSVSRVARLGVSRPRKGTKTKYFNLLCAAGGAAGRREEEEEEEGSEMLLLLLLLLLLLPAEEEREGSEILTLLLLLLLLLSAPPRSVHLRCLNGIALARLNSARGTLKLRVPSSTFSIICCCCCSSRPASSVLDTAKAL